METEVLHWRICSSFFGRYKKIRLAFLKTLFLSLFAWTWMEALQKPKTDSDTTCKEMGNSNTHDLPLSEQPLCLGAVRQKLWPIILKMALFYSSVLMNRDSVRVSQRARNHDPENEAAKWNVTAINLIIHTCTRSGPNVLSGKRGLAQKIKQNCPKWTFYQVHLNSIYLLVLLPGHRSRLLLKWEHEEKCATVTVCTFMKRQVHTCMG